MQVGAYESVTRRTMQELSSLQAQVLTGWGTERMQAARWRAKAGALYACCERSRQQLAAQSLQGETCAASSSASNHVSFCGKHAHTSGGSC